MSRVSALRHFGLVVLDLEKSLTFYERILNLRVVSRNKEDGFFLDTILGDRNIHLTTVKLASPSGETLLELLDFQSADSVLVQRQVEYFLPGPTHVAFTVENANEAHAAIIQAGCSCLSEPQLSPDERARVFFARDPEGNLLELVQPLKQTGKR
jgi:catechol 2,3-dioxygenase-like lactoylglutathione lyase family enzyme